MSQGDTRDDLLALSRAALVALANAGFVKRAERELEQGPAPIIEETSEGTTVAFADATVVLARGKTLAQCPCSCGATPMCRHRVAAVLAYQHATPSALPATPPEAADAEATAPTISAWSPGDTSDTALERLLGASALTRAKALMRRGLIAEVMRPGNDPDDIAQVHLPTSTVRFLVARDVGHARCDCALRTGCEHVALAVWAFREADAGPIGRSQLVALGGAGRGDARMSALATTLDVATTVLMEGVAHLDGGSATRFALARHALERTGLAWPLAALDALDEQVSAYRKRSARYDATESAAIVAELFARARAGAGQGHGAVPARGVLGVDEASETRLDQTRLVALGVHLEDDGDARLAHIYLAEPGGGVLVLTRRFAGTDDGAALAHRTALAGSSLGALASGQVVSNAAVRRASRALSFATGVLAKTSVLPGADLSALAGPLFITDVAALLTRLRAAPPRMLGPRLATADIVALEVHAISGCAYDDARQRLVASACDAAGNAFTIELARRPLAPGAVGALALSLGDLRAVVGRVHTTSSRVVVTPLSLHLAHGQATRALVLELAPRTDAGERALAALPHVALGAHESPLAEAIANAARVVAEAAHHGLRQAPAGFRSALVAGRERLAALGLGRAAHALALLERAHATALVTGAEPDERAAADAWASAAIRLTLLADRA